MAVEWTDPKTWTVEELLRAADLNTYLRDNLEYLYDAPRSAVRLTSAQEVANATDHTIAWDEAVWDSHGDMWDAGGPSKITITRAGVYSIHLSSLWEGTASGGKRAAYLHVNGTRRRGFYSVSADGVDPVEMSTSVETNLADGDELDVRVRQLSGTALDLQATRTVMTVHWVAAPPVSGE